MPASPEPIPPLAHSEAFLPTFEHGTVDGASIIWVMDGHAMRGPKREPHETPGSDGIDSGDTDEMNLLMHERAGFENR